MSAARRYLAPLAVILILLGAWEVAAQWDWIANALNIQDFLVPAPSDIATSLWDTWVTLREILLGFLCALAAGLAFAIVLHLSETLRRAFYPLLVASQTIPPVAIATRWLEIRLSSMRRTRMTCAFSGMSSSMSRSRSTPST